MPPRLTPEGRRDLALDRLARAAERDVLAAFRGVSPADLIAVWPRLSPEVRAVILATQTGALDTIADYLGGLVDSPVPVDPTPWRGRIGEKDLDEWLAVTPRAHAARIAGGMTLEQAAVATATYLAGTASSEAWRVGREASAVTASADYRFDGWARIAEPRACDFCRMLATRGAVYAADTVLRTFSGLRYHAHCRCTAKAMPAGDGALGDWRNAIRDEARLQDAGVMSR